MTDTNLNPGPDPKPNSTDPNLNQYPHGFLSADTNNTFSMILALYKWLFLLNVLYFRYCSGAVLVSCSQAQFIAAMKRWRPLVQQYCHWKASKTQSEESTGVITAKPETRWLDYRGTSMKLTGSWSWKHKRYVIVAALVAEQQRLPPFYGRYTWQLAPSDKNTHTHTPV